MSGDARALLERIRTFRHRLEKMPVLNQPVPTDERPALPTEDASLEERVRDGAHHQSLLERTLRHLSPPVSVEPGGSELPTHLIARAKRLLGEGKELIVQLRTLGDDPILNGAAAREAKSTIGTPPADPLLDAYRETIAMTEAALRLVQVFPDEPSIQVRLCDGLGGIFDAVSDRIRLVRSTVQQRGTEVKRIDTLALALAKIADPTGSSITAELEELTEAVLGDEIQQGTLRFATVDLVSTQAHPGGASFAAPTRFIAAHSLTVARVTARLLSGNRGGGCGLEPKQAVIAALLHDVGMLRVPMKVLAHAGPLGDLQKRSVQAHVRVGVELLLERLPDAGPIIEAVAQHHERLDGSGYPSSLKDEQIGAMARLLAVADVYAALATPRPHRSGCDPRTALTDTLLLAEKGLLDRTVAERLLRLAFYPVGSVVELADGSIGVVAANPFNRFDGNGSAALLAPSRPVVSILTERDGTPLSTPRFVDLTKTESGSIVRTVPPEQRRRLLGKRFPEFA